MSKLLLSTSTRTGLAPDKEMAFNVAGKVIFGTKISSSFLTSNAFNPRKIAMVPLVQLITYLTFKSLDIFFDLTFDYNIFR